MSDGLAQDHYDTLQVSANADLDTIHRVYRILAQRFHPDNLDTGSAERFRALSEAYEVLGNPERRAQYDITYQQLKQDRWRLVSSGEGSENDFSFEQAVRLTLLEALYTQRRVQPYEPGIFVGDFEQLIGRPREQIEFTVWYLLQKGLVQRSDNSRLTITAEGADHLESGYQARLKLRLLRDENPLSDNTNDLADQ
jgi:curved DNA-binding protein CbpA